MHWIIWNKGNRMAFEGHEEYARFVQTYLNVGKCGSDIYELVKSSASEISLEVLENKITGLLPVTSGLSNSPLKPFCILDNWTRLQDKQEFSADLTLYIPGSDRGIFPQFVHYGITICGLTLRQEWGDDSDLFGYRYKTIVIQDGTIDEVKDKASRNIKSYMSTLKEVEKFNTTELPDPLTVTLDNYNTRL